MPTIFSTAYSIVFPSHEFPIPRCDLSRQSQAAMLLNRRGLGLFCGYPNTNGSWSPYSSRCHPQVKGQKICHLFRWWSPRSLTVLMLSWLKAIRACCSAILWFTEVALRALSTSSTLHLPGIRCDSRRAYAQLVQVQSLRAILHVIGWSAIRPEFVYKMICLHAGWEMQNWYR